jgi:hypothetical protein
VVIAAQTIYIEQFCRQVETRSNEFQNVMPILIEHRAWIVAGSVLRMQVESVSRAVFLLNDPLDVRKWRVERSFEVNMDGKFPNLPPKHGAVPDTEMAILADEKVPGLQKSALSIYKLGCKLVHLSNAHDYEHTDPYQDLPADVRREMILDPLFTIWGRAGITTESTFAEVMEYASPRALRKLTELVNVSVKRLRGGESLDPAIGISFQ